MGRQKTQRGTFSETSMQEYELFSISFLFIMILFAIEIMRKFKNRKTNIFDLFEINLSFLGLNE